MGSQHPLAEVAPQHELPPLLTRKAACPYFSFTTSLISVLLMVSPTCRFEQSDRVSRLGCECSIRRTVTEGVPGARRCSRYSAERCSLCGPEPGLRLSTCRDDETESNLGYQVHPESRRRPGRRDERRATVA